MIYEIINKYFKCFKDIYIYIGYIFGRYLWIDLIVMAIDIIIDKYR